MPLFIPNLDIGPPTKNGAAFMRKYNEAIVHPVARNNRYSGPIDRNSNDKGPHTNVPPILYSLRCPIPATKSRPCKKGSI